MCKKLIVVCVLAMASLSYAEVVGDWGSGMDGWVNEWGLTTSDSTIGHTLGDGSLKVVSTSGWYQGSMDKVLSGAQVSMVANRVATTFSIDVTRFAADWTLPTLPEGGGPYAGDNGQTMWVPESRLFFAISVGARNEDNEWAYWGGGHEVLGANWYPTTLDPAHWPWKDGVQYVDPDGMMTATWSLTPVQDAVDGMIASGFNLDMGMDIRLIVNAPGYTGATVYYLDNAQIPEPATMTLLILGGLTLIRRKH
jgi:hypothetical protein